MCASLEHVTRSYLMRFFDFGTMFMSANSGGLIAGGVLVDEFDECAHNFAAIDDGAVVGSVRVVPDTEKGLPLERVNPLDGFRHGKRLVELSRLATAPSHRHTRLGALLMKAGYQCAVQHKASHILVDTYTGESTALGLYEKMGFEQVGAEYFDHYHLLAAPSVTLALDLKRALVEWPSIRGGLFRFFTSPDLRIDDE